MLGEAEQALHQSVNLTKQLLTFSKGGKPVKKIVPVRPVIENAVKFALSGSRIDYRITLDEHLRMVEADEGQIGQVIQNIVINAEQAMPLGGTVLITAKNGPEPGKPGNRTFVEITIKDTGIGISPQCLPRIFDPYFTTKEKGSGLGLATAYSIVRSHGGIIEVASEADKGTTVSVYLPAVEPETDIPDAPAVRSGKKGRILVMDDEELVRKIAGEMIAAGGHEIECAAHGEAAIEKYKSASDQGRPFDIVILDLTIRGGMGGKQAIEKLLEIDPSVKAVVSSGYSDDAVVSDFPAYGFAASLTKPYDFNELTQTLNRLLSRKKD
jgi:CheY-like chemotaxis protein